MTQEDAPSSNPTSGAVITRNVGINVIGWILPALAAVVSIPVLVRGLGVERFGLLAIAWTTLGYFGLFDLGLGRAVTHAVGTRVGEGRSDEVPGVIRAALGVLIPLGVAGALVLFAISPWLMTSVFDVPLHLRQDGITSYRILAIAVPFVGAAAVLRGALEARQRFGIVNAIRIPYGVLLFAGPAVALSFSRELLPAIAILVLVRLLLVAALAVVTVGTTTRVAEGGIARRPVRELLSYGGWMTVSNVISPLMNTFDQFVIGAALGVGFVTLYAGPFELATKLWLVTAAVYPVFFAAFATTGTRDAARSAHLFDRMLRTMFAALFVPVVVLVGLAPEILGVWLGPEFTGDSARVLQILAIAVFVNTLGQGALNLIQALGRPDLTGKFHLAELPFYAVLLWMLLERFGIVGVAIAWAVRATADAMLLLFAAPVLLRETRAAAMRTAALCIGSAALLAGLMILPETRTRLAAVAAIAVIWPAFVWLALVTPAERALLRSRPS
jgi:O-antigen/teichoic acid export membrane protein